MKAQRVLVALLAAMSGCLPIDELYRCATDDQCVRDGEQGVCGNAGFCAFRDEACPVTGYRYGAHAGDVSDACVVTGAIYWVSITGDDTAPGTEERPFRTVAHGVGVLAPGDTLLVQPGIYEEAVAVASAGESWEAPITILGWPRRQATLRASSGFPLALGPLARFVVVDGLVVDGGENAVAVSGDHVRIRDCEVRNASSAAITLYRDTSPGGDCELLDLDIHDNGAANLPLVGGSPAGGISVGTPRNIVEGCRVYDNVGVGILIYGGDTEANIARNNDIRGGARGDAAGIFVSGGAGIVVYNNIVHAVDGPGIRVDYGADAPRILNNTIHGAGLIGGHQEIVVSVEVNAAVVWNNALFDPVEGAGSLFNESVTTAPDYNVTVDPLFVDPDAGDFHVRDGSPLIDSGVEVFDVIVDYDGTPRPQGAGFDVGAFER